MKYNSAIVTHMLIPIILGSLWSCNNKKTENNRSYNSKSQNPSAGDQVSEGAIESESLDEKEIVQDPLAPASSDQTETSVIPPGPEMPENPSVPNEPPAPPAPAPPVKVYSLLGIRNFESIHSTFSVLTGVPKTTPAVSAAFEANKGALPSHSFAEDLTSNVVVGLYKLSGVYCDELAKVPALRAAVYGSFDFAGLPQAVLNDAGITALADVIVTRFWGKNLAKLAPHDSNVNQMIMTFRDMKSEFPGNTAADTVKIVNAACTAALMSTSAIVY